MLTSVPRYLDLALHTLRTITPRPADRWQALDVVLQPRKFGRKIIVATPDEKPCRYYGIDQQQWVEQTVAELKKYTDRPIEIRHRAPKMPETCK